MDVGFRRCLRFQQPTIHDAHPHLWGPGFRLHLDVNTTNAGARALYERAGYVATGETRPLRDGSDERVERMVRNGTRTARQWRHAPADPGDPSQ